MQVIEKVKFFIRDPKIELIFKGGVLSMFAKVFSLLIGLITNIIIARVYGADIVGLLAILNAIIMLSIIFSTVGMHTALLKLIPKYSLDEPSSAAFIIYKKIILVTTILSVIIGVLLFFASEFIANDIFHKSILNVFIPLVASIIIIKSYAIINSEMIRSFKKITSYAVMQLIPNLIIFILLISLMYINDSQYLPIYIYIFSTIIVVLIGWVFLHFLFVNQKKYTIPISSILETSLPMMLTASLFFFSTQTDTLMLGMMTSASNVGIYSIDVRLATLIIFVNVAMNTMMAPKFSEAYHANDTSNLKYIAKKSTTLIFWMTMPLAIIIIIFGKFFLSMFGEEFVVSYLALLLLTVGQIINSFSGPNGNFLNMTGHHKQLMYIVLASTIINIILNALLIPVYGIKGAAFATMTSMIIWNLTAVIYIKYKFDFLMFYNPFSLGKVTK